MSKVLMTIQLSEASPSLDRVRQKFSLGPDEVDARFGLVEIDPDRHLFTFLVEEGSASKVQSTTGWEIKGPYSNPRIEAFGPPVSEFKKTGDI